MVTIDHLIYESSNDPYDVTILKQQTCDQPLVLKKTIYREMR